MWPFNKKKKETEKFIVVDCSFSCPKEKCPKWVILYHNIQDENGKVTQKQEGKCAMAWLPSILTEFSGKVIDRLNEISAKMGK